VPVPFFLTLFHWPRRLRSAHVTHAQRSSRPFGQHRQFGRELNMTALQGWIVIGLLVLIVIGIVGLAAELQALPYLWRASAELIK